MSPQALIERLKRSAKNLDEIIVNTIDALHFLRDAITGETVTHNIGKGYLLKEARIGDRVQKVRPVNENLFLSDPAEFLESAKIIFENFPGLVGQKFGDYGPLLDSVVYTMAQAYLCSIDILVHNPRKLTGEKFEELMSYVVAASGIANRKLSVSIPYNGNTYRCQVDAVVSAGQEIKSNEASLDPDELILSCKTTSKDRMSKIFTDRLLLENFSKHSVKVAALFLHDVQRNDRTYPPKVSVTFVPGVFLVYWKFLTHLEGIFYLDPPPHVSQEAYRGKVFPFHSFFERLPEMLGR